MRLGWAKTKYSISYYVQKTVYINGKNKSQVVKRLGSEKYICQTYGVSDAKAWAKEQVRLMNEAEKEENATFSIELCAGTDLLMNDQRRFNGGYLFLQDIYYELGIHKICRAISSRHTFEYDLNDILSRLIYTRILFPASKKSSFAHFITCFIALIVYRYLEQKLDNKYTIDQILSTLQEMDFVKYEGKGYQPVYTRTKLTDALHNAFGFCTSKEIIPISKMRNICSQTKK